MSYNDKVLLNGRNSLFKPQISRTGNDFNFSNSVQDFQTIKDFGNTNIESTSSFRYQSKKGIVSTQEIKIDYSKFENHTFFHSAVAKTNEAFDEIINRYPFDGDNKEIESFQDELTGFEKYVYDQFPKNVGYVNLGGSDSAHIEIKDGTGIQYPTISRNKKTNYILNPGTGSFTFEMYLKTAASSTNNNQVILQKRDSISGVSSNHITLFLEDSSSATDANIKLSISSGSSGNYLNVSAPIKKEKWHHISAIYDSELEYSKIYVDGINVYTSSFNQKFDNINLAGNLNISYGSDFRTGSDSSDAFSSPEKFEGSIDEFRYFKSARTQKQIQKYQYKNLDFNALSDESHGLTCYLKFNEPVGSYSGNNVVFDHSGNSLHTDITNFVVACRTTGSDVPVLAEDKTINPVLFPNFSNVITLNQSLMTTASFYDDANPNLITKLVPPHYFEEGNEEEGFSKTLGKFTENYSGGALPNQVKFKSAQLLTIFLLIWGKHFDELKLYIDAVTNLKNITYDDFDVAPDNLLHEVGKLYGIDLPPLFKGSNVEQLIKGINFTENPSQSQISLLEIQNIVWRRILVSLPFLRRKKGTLESVKSLFRSAGIEPDNIFTIREYGGNSYNKIDNTREEKIDVIKMLNFSGSNADVTTVDDANGRPDKKPTLVSGFLSGSRTQFGYPELHSFSKATATIVFNNANISDGHSIIIRDSNGKRRQYVLRTIAPYPPSKTGTIFSVATDELINVGLHGLSSDEDIANELKKAIEHQHGHNGTISVVNSGGSPSTLTLTQLRDGDDLGQTGANSTITKTSGVTNVTLSGFSGGVGMQTSDSNFYNGISSFSSHGLLTSGSFTYEGQYYFDTNGSYDDVQSLVRMHTTGSAATNWEGLITNLLYDKSTNELELHYNDNPSSVTRSVLTMENVNLITNDLWSISFGYNREPEIPGKGSLFLRLGRQIGGKIYNYQTSSMYITDESDSVFRNITTNYNASGSFLSFGNQKINTSVSEFLNQFSDSILTGSSGQISNIKFFSKHVTEEEFKSHIRDPLGHGLKDPKTNYLFENNATGSFEKLRLLTDAKQHTTASDASGNFRLFDFSQNELHLEGKGFEASKNIVAPLQVQFKKLSSNFDISIADSKIRIRSLQDATRREENFYANTDIAYEVLPSEATIDDPRFSIDMSVMKGLNEQIMKIFSDYSFFDKAMGEPNLLFSSTYPDLVKMRRLYFNNVISKLDLGKYTELFKWIDNSLTGLVFDMIPYTTKFMGINFVYENHVLDRNRFRYLHDDIYLRAEKIVSIARSKSQTLDNSMPELQSDYADGFETINPALISS